MARSEEKPSNRAGESKADARYWLQGNRLQFHDSADYSARFQIAGRREWFPLGSPNKRTAAAQAAKIYSYIRAHGIDAAVAEFKPKPTQEKEPATVGQFIEVAKAISSARAQSLDAYVKALRRIVSEIMGIEGGRKHCVATGGTKKWQAAVDAVPLSEITPTEVNAWKHRRLRANEGDAIAKRRSVVTVNSLVRNARSLFGKKVLPHIETKLQLERPLPFDGVFGEKPPSLRYRSKIDARALLAAAQKDLRASNPEAFKALLLALVCGLRRSEIDHLLWSAFDFQGRVLHVENTEYHELKSEDSAGRIDLDPDTAAVFQGFHARDREAVFVIESHNPPRNEMKSRGYRCDRVFAAVNKWLREYGVSDKRPLHCMRKEIGSLIAAEKGIFAASAYLRHSDIRITRQIYADAGKVPVIPQAFEGILKPSNIVSLTAPKQQVRAKKGVKK